MRKINKIIVFNLMFIIMFVAISFGVVNSVIKTSVNRAEEVGKQMAENYNLKDYTIFTEYKTSLEMASYRVEKMRQEGRSIDDIRHWIVQYTDDIMFSDNEIYSELYAYIDGHIVSGSEWEAEDFINWHNRNWYKGAMQSDGEVYYSDIYIDSRFEQLIVTMAKKIGNDDVLAMDIPIENIRKNLEKDNMSSGNLYVSYDRNGEVLGHKCWFNGKCIHDMQYLKDLYNATKNNGDKSSFKYTDKFGNDQIVYTMDSETGWKSVAVVPYQIIGASAMDILHKSLIFLGLYLIILIIIMIKSYINGIDARNNKKALYFIGNTYYAIYFVDINKNTFNIVKTPDAMMEQLVGAESYDDLLETVLRYVEPDARDEFRKGFSLENIKKLSEDNVERFGGDFQKKCQGVYKWVNVQLLFDSKEFNKNQVILTFKVVDDEKIKEIEQKQLLEQSLLTAQASSKAKNDFLSNMSHDMRTPLNAIIGLSKLAEMRVEKGSNVYEYLRKINFSSRHLLGLINDVLDMAKIEQGKIELKKEDFDIINLVNDVVAVFKKQTENKNISVKFDVKNTVLYGDMLKISQILNNLISNAIKFSNDGGHIDISVKEVKSNYDKYGVYQFIVKDDGIGISEEFMKKLFMPFEREERFVSGYVSGTGLGMPIVKNIVRIMNGKIDVNSKVNEGTEFIITIPLDYSIDALNTVNNSDNEKDFDSEKVKLELKGKNILLVEDNAINMEITKEIIEIHGGNVVQAWNGEEAISKFYKSEEGYFDIILMDMQMPVLDGCGATEKIRELNRSDAKSVPIIAVTANAFSDDIAKAMKSGMNEHISKPIDFNILMNIIGKYIFREGFKDVQ